MAQPNVNKAHTWMRVFGARPTRGVVVRAAGLFHAVVHGTGGYFNYANEKAFRREAHRLLRWYKPGRRLGRWHRGIIRSQAAPAHAPGIRSAVTRKVRQHMKRLRKPLRVEGMMQWRKVALATRKAGIPVHSGTVPVERLWSLLKSMLPPAARFVSVRWFKVLAALMFVRYNLSHFRSRKYNGIAERDPLIAHQIATLELLVHAVSDDGGVEGLGHLTPLFDPFTEP